MSVESTELVSRPQAPLEDKSKEDSRNRRVGRSRGNMVKRPYYEYHGFLLLIMIKYLTGEQVDTFHAILTPIDSELYTERTRMLDS